MTFGKLEVFSDLSERVGYNLAGFPMYVSWGELRFFRRYCVACHWHPDLEYIHVLDGEMEYFINGQIVPLKKGEGIFINSKRLHYNYSKDSANCIYITAVIHPALLGSETPFGKKYFESAFGFAKEDYILLSQDIEWQKEALQKITDLYSEMHRPDCSCLRLLAQVNSLCAGIADNIQTALHQQTDENLWHIVWDMTGFIQKNYADKITLNDIAAAGSVCRSQCCKLFNMYIGQTPNDYLTQYRINKSCEMLQESSMSVTEISTACGFQSPSYFTQIFRSKLGLTPKEYRNQ